jgi:hypothetical protein
MRRGNPCTRRFKVYKSVTYYGMRWRVFELAQPGQHISDYGDMYYDDWTKAMAYADLCAQDARRECAHQQRKEEA